MARRRGGPVVKDGEYWKDDPAFKRLPLWARHHIEKLDADVEYWKAQAHAACTLGESNTTLWDFTENAQLGLPPDAKIRFTLAREPSHPDLRELSEQQWITAGIIEDEPGKPILEIRAYHGLVLRPHSRNVITLEDEPI